MNEVLTKHGVSDEDASYYSGRMKEGGLIVTVDNGDYDDGEVRQVLYRNGGHNSSQARTAAL